MRKLILASGVLATIAIALFILRGCQPSLPIQPRVIYTLYLPMVAKNHNAKLAAMRGVAASGNGGVEAVRQTGASFYLNWWYQPSAGMPTNVEFVPMISAPQYPMPDTIADSEYLMGANEPNVYGQVQTCPADYVATWREIENRYGDRKLVSPGVGSWGNTWCYAPDGKIWQGIGGVDWLTDFRVFYHRQYGVYPQWSVLSFHCYPPPEAPCGDFRAATDVMVALADEWNIDEVWITEWDAGKLGAQDPQRIRNVMAYWLTVSKVTRIAYYQDWAEAAPQNSPLTDASGQITEYGKAYR